DFFVNTLRQLIFSNLRPPWTSQPQLVTGCRDVRGKHSQHPQDERRFRVITNDPGADLGVEQQHSHSENYKWQSHRAEKDCIPESVTLVRKSKRPAQKSQSPAQYHDPRERVVTQDDPRDALGWANASQKGPKIFQRID